MHRAPFIACGFLGLACLAAVRSAASQDPRFTLPPTPYDYGLVPGPVPESDRASRARDTSAASESDRRADHLATLGRVLFYDPLLSRNGSRSCASCHEQAKAFTDGRARSLGFDGRLTRRSSMSLSGLARREGGFFWDTRIERLEDMVLRPIEDPIEMGLSLAALERRIAKDASYAPLFAAAFGDGAVDRERIGQALAAFVRALSSRGSRYDEGLAAAGSVWEEFAELTPEENRGKRLFFEACASCHVREQAIGHCGSCRNFDPSDFESALLRNNGIDGGSKRDDPGLGAITGKPEDRGRFRAPTLRNIELTAPYMHDGRFATLEDVLRFYAHRVRPHPALDARLKPGGTGWTAPSANRGELQAPALGLRLDSHDQADLIAFLKTLTDLEFTKDPRFADPFVAGARTSITPRRAESSSARR